MGSRQVQERASMGLLERGLSPRDEDDEDEDSAVDLRLPDVSGVEPRRDFDPLEDSTASLRLSHDAIVVSIQSAEWRREVCDALAPLDVTLVGKEWTADAVLVISDLEPDLHAQLAAIRKVARPDTAIFLVGVTSPEAVREAHAAGAYACLRAPLVVEELVRFVTTALDARTTRARAADLADKLDLEAHLASIGRMSAGLAHEISSPLFTATMNLEAFEANVRALVASVHDMLQANVGDLARAQVQVARDLAELESAGLDEALAGAHMAHDRLRVIVAQMRALMQRDREADLAPVDVAALLSEARSLASAELVGVEVAVVDEPAVALADKDCLTQILQNLLTNAAQAAKTLSSPRVRLHTYLTGDSVVVSVRDNGPGIGHDMQQRVFEPFFTTRRSLGGTGLGLALCREYALRMRAELSLWSAPGRGACFRVKMPRVR